jgi:hypothetical protein
MAKAGGYGVWQRRRREEERGREDGFDGDGRRIGRKVKAWRRCGMLTL